MSSPRHNIMRTSQVQHRQGFLTSHCQSSNHPATWSPGYSLLDHKALLKTPAAPAGSPAAAAPRRLVLSSSKHSPSEAWHGAQRPASAPSAPKVTKAFLRQRFQAQQDLLLTARSLQAAAAAGTSAASLMSDAAAALPNIDKAATRDSNGSCSGSSTLDINSQRQNVDDAGYWTAAAATTADPPVAAHQPPLIYNLASGGTDQQQLAVCASCKPSCFPLTISKLNLKITVPNPPAFTAESPDAANELISPPSHMSILFQGPTASNASTSCTTLVDMPNSQLYPPGVAAPAQLSWGAAASAYSPACYSHNSGYSAATSAAVLAGKPLTASEHVAVTILHSCSTLEQQQQQEQEQASLVSLALLLDGGRVHAVITPLQSSSGPPDSSSPASSIVTRLTASSLLAAGDDAGVMADPVLAAAVMHRELPDSFEEAYPETPGMSIARKRWQAAGAAIIFFQKHFGPFPCLQDEMLLQAEPLAADVLGPSSMMTLWRNSATPAGMKQLHGIASSQAAASTDEAYEEASAVSTSASLEPAASAVVKVAGSVAHVHLELDSSMFDVLSSAVNWSTTSVFTAVAGCHSTIGSGENTRTSVLSLLPSSCEHNTVLPTGALRAPFMLGRMSAPTLANSTAGGSDATRVSRSHAQPSGKGRPGRRSNLDAILGRKAQKHVGCDTSPPHPRLGLGPTQHSMACNDRTSAGLRMAAGHSGRKHIAANSDTSSTQPAAPGCPANSPCSSYSSSGQCSLSAGPLDIATAGVSGTTAQVRQQLDNIMAEIRAVNNQDHSPGEMREHSINNNTGVRGAPPEEGDVLYADVWQRTLQASQAAALTETAATFGRPHAGTAHPREQPLAGTWLPRGLAEWEEVLRQSGQSQQLRSSRRRRRCRRGAPPQADDSDSLSGDEPGEDLRARAVLGPACESAVPAAAASLEPRQSVAAALCGSDQLVLAENGLQEQSNCRGSRDSRDSINDGYGNGSFTVPEQEEEAEAQASAKQSQHRTAAGRGIRRWWRHRVGSTFRKAASCIFGPPGSSSTVLQVLERTYAAARASADTAGTEDDEEVAVAQATTDSSVAAGKGQSTAGRVGHLAKLFSVRSRRDSLLAAGDQ